MGFWHVYMGIYGGGSDVAETVVRLTATTRQQITATTQVQIRAEAG